MFKKKISTNSFYSFLNLLAIALLLCYKAHSQSLFNDVSYKGSRSHQFDVLHIFMDLKFDEANKKVSGMVEHTVKSLHPNLKEVRLDIAENMVISGVLADDIATGYERDKEHLTVKFAKPRKFGEQVRIKISYSVSPKKGMYFIQPDSNKPKQRYQIWTQGEAEDNHYWLPMYDFPNDLATTELKATVAKDYKVLSNGEFISTKENQDGTATWHYKMTKPHASYLIMIAIGDYLVTKSSAGSTPLEYWSYKDMPERVNTTFGRTPDVINYFEKLLDVKYPWNKYAQVFIAEFMYGGMENTTATTLNDNSLVDEFGFIDNNPDGLIAHEAAHQWFGDLVTNRYWGHLWLHESFATYLAARYMGYRYGNDELVMDMINQTQSAINNDLENGRDPIANGKGLTANIYGRGSRVLYMLNKILGEELFWKSINLFLTRHTNSLVESNDLKIAFEDATGENLDWFFRQWIYQAGMPEYTVSYAVTDNFLKLNVKQTQKQDSLTGLFKMPIVVEVYSSENSVVEQGTSTRTMLSVPKYSTDTIWVTKADSTYLLPITSKPQFVIFDAENIVMKKLNFKRTQDELLAQIRMAPRFSDRVMAVRELATIYPDTNSAQNGWLWTLSIDSLFATETNPFVRQEIVEAMQKARKSVLDKVVLLGLQDPNRNVRKSALDIANRVSDKNSLTNYLRPLLIDSSYSVKAKALGLLAKQDTTGLTGYLLQMKGVKGRRGRFSTAWLQAVASGNFRHLINDATDYTKPEYGDFTRVNAYETLAKLDTINNYSREAIKRGVLDKNNYVSEEALQTAKKYFDADMQEFINKTKANASKELLERIEKVFNPKKDEEKATTKIDATNKQTPQSSVNTGVLGDSKENKTASKKSKRKKK